MLKKYKNIILFLIKFLGSYAIMLVLYSFYLSNSQNTTLKYTCDPITQKVGNKSVSFLKSMNIDAQVLQHQSEKSMKLFINNRYVARVVEGCNAMSVIILFIAFIIAFSGTFVKTLLYILAGVYMIFYINIARIALIAVAIFYYPEYSDFLHQIVFPLIIYGTTFLLWVIWINFFLKKKHDA
ncbi:MAG: exosortase family protein XrtF [Bacteroidetes bacterium]|nr:exosortase family protein XrtF [Bacteroidota bacterium]